MNNYELRAVTDELAASIADLRFGKIFQLSRLSLAIDLRRKDNRYLFVSIEPGNPRIYLIERRIKDLEKSSVPLSPFGMVLKKYLGGSILSGIRKLEDERVIRFSFETEDALGERSLRTLVAQVTGRSANLLLLNADDIIIDALRPPRGEGQNVGERYYPPPVAGSPGQGDSSLPDTLEGSVSRALDRRFLELEESRRRASLLAGRRQSLKSELSRKERLLKKLEADRVQHGDAEQHKRIGDLLLANLATAKHEGSSVTLTDYFDPAAPTIRIDVDENVPLQKQAARLFARYAKAKRAEQEIDNRVASTRAVVNELKEQLAQLVDAAEVMELPPSSDERQSTASSTKRSRKNQTASTPGVRRYVSTDGLEILVGRGAKDNDELTFKLAKASDIWLHASDYPGSHVVIRNPSRTEVPHRTIVEAAQLAAFFSQAREDSKVNVNYTQRKYLAKPRGAAPGLVRISSFRTLLVEPREALQRL